MNSSQANKPTHAGASSLRGLGMGFGIYTPRRNSYTLATRESRHRSCGSYRSDTNEDQPDSITFDQAGCDDYIQDVTSCRRKTSYVRATSNPSTSFEENQRGDSKDEKEHSRTDACLLGDGEHHYEFLTSSETAASKYREKSKNDPNSHTEIQMAEKGASTSFKNKFKRARLKLKSKNRNNENIEVSKDVSNNKAENSKQNKRISWSLRKPYPLPITNNVEQELSLTEVTLIQSCTVQGETIIPQSPNGILYSNDELLQIATNTTPNTTDNNIGHASGGTSAMGPNHSYKIWTSPPTSVHFNKNLVILSIVFILMYSSFNAIQNLQSSINSHDNLGAITMILVHLATVISCLFAPVITNNLSAKWALCLGVICFSSWFGANSEPSFASLVPTSILVGVGQGIVWSAETSYIHKLAFDVARISKGSVDKEMFKFHGIFLACFQTTHIWGNLISSLWLSQRQKQIAELNELADSSHITDSVFVNRSQMVDGVFVAEGGNHNGEIVYYDAAQPVEQQPRPARCGALFRCEIPLESLYPDISRSEHWKG